LERQGAAISIVLVVAIVSVTLAGVYAYYGQSVDGKEAEAIVILRGSKGTLTLRCEVADCPSERAAGLSDRDSLAGDAGMLFIFEEPENHTFWMKDTEMPLDIVFVDQWRRVVNVEEAMPEPGVPDHLLTRYGSDAPCLWVVEMNAGLAAEMGIGPGTPVTITLAG